MSGPALYLAIIIPALATAGFGVWLGLAFHAGHHPRCDGRVAPLAHTVQGGAFQGGGRQVTPRRDATPPEAQDYQDGG
jgi:hypothetical protein